MKRKYYSISSLLLSVIFFALPVHASVTNCTVAIRNGSNSALSSVGGEIDAPQFREYSISRGLDNSLYILDPLSDRVLFFDSNCKHQKTFLLDKLDAISAIALVGDNLFGISSNGNVKKLLVRNGSANPVPSRQNPGEHFGGIDTDTERAHEMLQNIAIPLTDRRGTFKLPKAILPGEVAKVPSENRRFMTDGMPILGQNGVWYKYTFESLTNKSGLLVIKKTGSQEPSFIFPLQSKDNLGAVEVSGVLSDGTIAIAAEIFSVTSKGQLRVTLEMLLVGSDKKIVRAGSYKFPVPADKSHGRPTTNSTLLKAGSRATFLIPIVTGRGLTFREFIPTVNSKSSNISTVVGIEAVGSPWKEMEPASISSYRQAILGRAEAYLNLEWVVSASGLIPPGAPQCEATPTGWKQPYFLRNALPNTTVYGVPYSWGGKESIDTIAQRLKNGAIAGNVCCINYVDPKTGKSQSTSRKDATGVDCSGFVSRSWDLKNKDGKKIDAGTSTLPEYSITLTAAERLLPGDAISRSGDHVRLFSAWVTKPLGLRIRAYESTTDSLCSGVCERDLPIRLYHDYVLLGIKDKAN